MGGGDTKHKSTRIFYMKEKFKHTIEADWEGARLEHNNIKQQLTPEINTFILAVHKK